MSTESRMELAMNASLKAMKNINDKYKIDNMNRGKIKCPMCQGILHYTRTESNGHIWGSCETKGCLSWMQ